MLYAAPAGGQMQEEVEEAEEGGVGGDGDGLGVVSKSQR